MKFKVIFLIGFGLFLFRDMVCAQSIDPVKTSKRPTVGLVLSGGGAKGFTYIGLLKVIQEAGLPVDYIGGTSIGSVMAGLYAIGYHPDSIIKMVHSIHWDKIMTDEIDRKYLAYEEKEFAEKFILTLPIANKKVTLSPSLYQGQEIGLLLNHYFSPAFNVSDFNDLQTPFLCLATDLMTGEEVVLNSGYLPMAIRASMSIPGYFAPVDYQGKYLVDGGVVNNFPVKDVKMMGADIIISGDDQPPLRSKREDFNSLTEVLDQIITFNRTDANKLGLEMSDIYIPLDTKYEIMDFEDYDSIIAFGERTARHYFPRIKALADSLNAIEYKPLKPYTATPVKEVHVNKLEINGYKRMSKSYFNNYFDVKKDTVLPLAELEKNIRLIYGSRFFEQVNYEFGSENEKNHLIINVIEADPGYISAGIHYDGDYGVSVLANGAFRNVLGKRSKLFTDLVLGESPRVRAFYMLDNGGKPGLGAKIEFYSFNFDTYDKDVKTNEITFTNYKASAFVNYTLKNFFNLRGGFEYEYFRFKQKFNNDSLLNEYGTFSSYGNFFILIGIDTRNKAYFPTKGIRSELRAEYVMPLSQWTKDLFTSSFIVYLKYEFNHPITKRVVFRPGLFAGSTLSSKNAPPPQHMFGFGGMNPNQYLATSVPFAGVHFIQRNGYHAAIFRLKLQYNVYRKIYLTLLTDAGSIDREFEHLFDPANYILGYGGTVSYDSFIGPLEITLMGSNLNSKPLVFLNLGFWF